MTTPEEELAQILGGGGQSPEDELAGILGGGKDTFKPWSGPDQIPLQQRSSAGRPQWSGDALDTLADFGQRAGMSATMGYGDEALGALGADQGAIRNRVQLAKERSPTASLWGDIVGGAAPAIAMAPAMGGLSLGARVVVGAGLGGEQAALSASGYADDGNRGQAALDALPIGAALGGAGELAASGVQGAGNLMQSKVAPWLRDQGLLNRAASTGRPGQALSNEFGGRQGIIDAGQWMEDQGMTQWSPNKLQSNLNDFSSMRQGDQANFLDELAQNPDAYPVDTGSVAQSLLGQGEAKGGMAAQNAQQQAGQYAAAGNRLADASPQGNMPFEGAWKQRQEFDQGAKWNLGPNGDQGLAAVNRDAATGLRDAMGNALDNTSPELRPRWEGIQSDLSNSLGLSGGGDAATARSLGSAPTPVSLRSMAAAAGGGPLAYGGALAAQSGYRGAAADTLGAGSQALDWLGSQGSNVADTIQVGTQMGAEQYGERQGIKESRGYLLPQAAQQLMSQSPQELGAYQKQFFDTYKDPDSHALSNLITKLSRTDPQFRATVLPKLQQLTAEGY